MCIFHRIEFLFVNTLLKVFLKGRQAKGAMHTAWPPCPHHGWGAGLLIQPVLELDRGVAAIAEWLVGRGATAAQGLAVADLIASPFALCTADAAAQDQQAADPLARILQQRQRYRQGGLDRLAGGVVPGHQPPRGTLMRHIGGQLGMLFADLDLVPKRWPLSQKRAKAQ